MKKILLFLLAFSSPVFAIDKPIPCSGNSCKLLFETTGSGGAKVSAGNIDGVGSWTVGSSSNSLLKANGTNNDLVLESVGSGGDLIFKTNGTQSGRVSATSGGAWFLNAVQTSKSSLSIPHSTATTIYALPGAGRYEVSCFLASIGNYYSFATVVHDGTNARIVANNAGNSSLTLSGTNIQCTQLSGGTQTMQWNVLRIGG